MTIIDRTAAQPAGKWGMIAASHNHEAELVWGRGNVYT